MLTTDGVEPDSASDWEDCEDFVSQEKFEMADRECEEAMQNDGVCEMREALNMSVVDESQLQHIQPVEAEQHQNVNVDGELQMATDQSIELGEERNQNNCTICLEPLDMADFRTLRCMHVFHHVCIAQWLEYNTVCPNCRTCQDIQEIGSNNQQWRVNGNEMQQNYPPTSWSLGQSRQRWITLMRENEHLRPIRNLSADHDPYDSDGASSMATIYPRAREETMRRRAFNRWLWRGRVPRTESNVQSSSNQQLLHQMEGTSQVIDDLSWEQMDTGWGPTENEQDQNVSVMERPPMEVASREVAQQQMQGNQSDGQRNGEHGHVQQQQQVALGENYQGEQLQQQPQMVGQHYHHLSTSRIKQFLESQMQDTPLEDGKRRLFAFFLTPFWEWTTLRTIIDWLRGIYAGLETLDDGKVEMFYRKGYVQQQRGDNHCMTLIIASECIDRVANLYGLMWDRIRGEQGISFDGKPIKIGLCRIATLVY